MIIFDLHCAQDHPFEGWFRSHDDFVDQQERGLVTCPACGDHSVRRVPSAIAIGQTRQPPAPFHPPSPTELRALMRQFASAIRQGSEDVGARFPEEARRIFHGDLPERPIRGQATRDEVEALLDEGVPVLPIPDISGDDLN